MIQAAASVCTSALLYVTTGCGVWLRMWNLNLRCTTLSMDIDQLRRLVLVLNLD